MAEVTVQLVKTGGTLLTVTFDDETEVLDRFDLVTDRQTRIELWRNSNNAWRDFVLEAGDYTWQAGGPVRDLDDIQRYVLEVSF